MTDASDVADLLRRAAQRLGHRPALSVLLPTGRQEQGVASLAQWAAKGAHLLEADLLLDAGAAIRLDAPWSWPAAAVALAAWWAGVTIDLSPDSTAEVAVVAEARTAPAGRELLWVGDGIDGAPRGAVEGEAWAMAVQAFPDQPPAPRAAPDRIALRVGDRVLTQAELVGLAGRLGSGTAGLDPDTGGHTADRPAADVPRPAVELTALTLRPLVTGRPTVVLRGVGREAAAGDRVGTWV